ncbi:galaxin-like [Argopecten irradians]|uniref:galaxin-like n=1 Tax=Argopecten irradians TaxID=31199 RepID=UPI0037249C1E
MTSIQTQVYFLCLIGHIYTTDTCYQPISLQPCGGRWLDSQLEFCCNNVPHSIDSNQCCCIDTISGTQVLHTKDQICCGGQLFNKTDSFGMDQNCCGPEVVRESDKTKMCCYPPTPKTTQSGPLPRLYHYHRDRYPFWENASCCSNSIIDKTTQKCCNNKINEITMDTSNWHCCNQTAYDDRSHYCDKGDPNNHTVKLYIIDHCDGIPFYKHLNTCCDGVLYPYHDKRNYECCGNQIRNLMTEQCCTESSRVISRSRLCCGSFPTGIDGATHVCCPHPRNSSEKLVLHKKAPQARQCCGYGVYNNDLEFCCMGKPYPRSDYQRCGETYLSPKTLLKYHFMSSN